MTGEAVGTSASSKPALRRALRQQRAAYVAALSTAERARLERQLAQHVLSKLPQNPVTPTIALYAAYGDEIDPQVLGDALRGAGWQIAFPRVDSQGGSLRFHACSAQHLQPGFRGIAEPPAAAPAVEPAIILLPLLAADHRGNRLGQGAGHYDRTLAQHGARRIGLGWDLQWVEDLPADPWDIPLDIFVAPGGWHDCTRAPSG